MTQLIVGSIVLVLALLGWSGRGVGEEVPAPRGELRIVDTDPLNWSWVSWHIFDHLVEIDKDGKLVPGLATTWQWLDDRTLEMTLRQGVKFHNGEVFDADIVKLNWEANLRLRQPHRSGDYWNFKPGSRLEIIDPYTVRFVLPEPDGAAMARLVLTHMANRQFHHEVGWEEKSWWIVQGAGPWGTGPYTLVEGFSLPDKRTDRVILEANPEYWDQTRLPRLQRIIFDNTLAQHDAVELVKSSEGRVDLVSELSPLETLRVAESPFAKVVKNRNSLGFVFGQFNMRKAGSPWRDVRLRQAVNFAINREDLIRYATKGNGVIVPALLPVNSFGYDPDLAPYAFDPVKARTLLREAGYPDGLAVTLIAPPNLEIQATVVGKMLEQAGFTVERQMLDPTVYNRKTRITDLDQPAEQQAWDIALTWWRDVTNFPAIQPYHLFALDGPYDWVVEEPELPRLYAQLLRTVNREQQQALIRQMERHTHAQAYFLFLYNPIKLYAVNKAVEFVPYVNTTLNLTATSVTEQHWSVRKQKAAGQE